MSGAPVTLWKCVGCGMLFSDWECSEWTGNCGCENPKDVPFEPIVFAPLPSAETRVTVMEALNELADADQTVERHTALRVALAELTAKGWGE